MAGGSKTAFNAKDAWRALPDTHAQVISKGAWRPFPYLRLIGDEIVKARQAGGGVILVNIPPRHGKSEFCDYHVPCWWLDNWPAEWVILAGYGSDLSRRYGRRVRNTITGEPIIETEVAGDSQAAEEWETTAGGGMVSTGIGGALTGKGGKLIVVDDPVKNWEEADSEVYQESVFEWFKTTLFTRREPGAVIVVIMTRWHMRDLTGRLTSKDFQGEVAASGARRWVHIVIPALAEENDLLSRQPGEALCPERYNVQALNEIRATMGSRHWCGLYQQRPINTEDQKVKPHWIQYFPPANKPVIHRAYITTDQAFSLKKDADYSVITSTLVDEHGNFYVWEVIRGRMSVGSFVKATLDLAERTPALQCIGLEVPVGEASELSDNSAILNLFRREMEERASFFLLQPVRSNKDKLTRASGLLGRFYNGRVYIRQGLTFVEDELLNFPTGEHDDIVDTLSMADLIIKGVKAKKKADDSRLPPSHMAA